MITLSFQGETAEQVSAALADFYKKGLNSVQTAVADDKFPKHEMPAEQPSAKPAAKKAKTEAKPEAKAEVPPVDDVRAALKKLASEKGDDEVWKLLESFKAKSASTVAETDRAALIAKVAEIVG